MKIAILESDPDALERAVAALSSAGHSCVGASSDSLLMPLLGRHSIDLVILNWVAPDRLRYETLRQVSRQLPMARVVLCASQRTAEHNVVAGLHAGADIIIDKPVGSMESLARINALGRNLDPRPLSGSETLVAGDFRFHSADGTVQVRGQRIRLTSKEFSLALLLFRNLSQTLTRVQIATAVWQAEIIAKSRTIDTHICAIRAKLGLFPKNGYFLRPIYRCGYRLERMRSLHAGSRRKTGEVPAAALEN